MPTDIEIANAAKPFKISKIAAKLDLTDEDIVPYGHYMAKISRAKTAAFARPATQPTTKTSPAVTDTTNIACAARTFASEPREPSNKQPESFESVTAIAGGKSAEPLRARECVAISGITADVLPQSNERTLPAENFASEPREPSEGGECTKEVHDPTEVRLPHANSITKFSPAMILVTAMTPTQAGEGKSTISIGLADALRKLKKKAILALREPSLGPCFGVKGGATGGGMSQIIPMDDINLNFTGDIHAITAANNLLAAMIDNHIKFGNKLDFKKVCFRRCLDLNDRALRQVTVGGGKNGTPRTDGFNISVASEVMAILCLAEGLDDLKSRLNQIVVGENSSGAPILAKELHAAGAMATILKDAMLPNLVQTLEHTPALVHGGPFANIAHGTSSVIAARTALGLADYVVTEAGFGADLGAEKFFDIFGRKSGLFPDAVVLVATVRALKMHGGVAKTELDKENLPAVRAGFANLAAHIRNLRQFGAEPIVALNRFTKDTAAELRLAAELCRKEGVEAVVAEGWAKGGRGCVNLAKSVLKQLELNQSMNSCPHLLYADSLPLIDKITAVATRIYGARKVTFSAAARRELAKFTRWGYGELPVCIAKTQNSISHDKNLLGAPHGYTFPITEARLSAGAGFVVALSGEIYTMPGLPRRPAAEDIDVDNNGTVTGLF